MKRLVVYFSQDKGKERNAMRTVLVEGNEVFRGTYEQCVAYCKRNGYKFLDDCPWFSDFNFIQSSDAHFIEDIAKVHSVLEMPFFSFDNFKDALRQGEPVIL